MIGTAARSSTRPTGPSLAQLSPLRPTRLSRRLVPAMQTRQKPWPCKVARPSQQPTSDEDAFATMKAAMPTCLANLITSPSGLRGLTASRSLQQGEVILFVPHTHTVSVPTGGAKSVAQWEMQFLQPWQAKHRPLPPALVGFLADTREDATTRLSAWLLYLQKYHIHSSSSTAGNNSNGFWRAWLTVLPRAEEATNANGFWTPAELQQLQLEPYKGVMTAVNDLSARMCDHAYTQLQSGDLGRLQLAETGDEVKWGVFATRTRASSHGDRVTLRPLHDLINHADTPNATCSLTEEGYSIEALTYIPAGTEITISYTGDEPAGSDLGLSTPSLELLMTWGFTLGPKPQDLIIPMQYHALPALDWGAVLSAAAAVVAQQTAQHTPVATQRSKQQAAGPASLAKSWMTGIKSQQELLILLQAAVANLPLTTPSSTAGNSSSSTAAPARLYRPAAEVISTYGLAGCCCADAAAAGMSSAGCSSSSTVMLVSTAAEPTGPQQRAVTSPPIDLETAVAQTPAWAVYERSYLTQLQLQELQAQFVSDLTASLSTLDKLRLMAAAAAAAGPIAAIAAALPLAFLHGLSGSSSSSSGHTAAAASGSAGSPTDAMRQGRQRAGLQLLVVTALLCEAQFAVLQSGTTIEQDEALLAFLQGKSAKSAWAATPAISNYFPAAPAATRLSPAGSAAAAAADWSGSRAGRSMGSAAAAAAAGVGVGVDAADGDVDVQQQRALPGADSFKQRQQAVLRQLLLLQAEEVLAAGAPAPVAVAASAGAFFAVAPSSKHQFEWQQASGKLPWAAGHAAAAAAPMLPLTVLTGSFSAALQGPVGVGLPMNVSAAIKVIKTLLDKPPASAAAAAAVDMGLQPVAFTAAERKPELSTWQSIATALALQERTITWQTQQQQQQQQQQQRRPSSLSAHAAACQAVVSEAAVLLSTGQVSRARFMAAVSARLQQKRLLQAYIALLQELQQQLKSSS